MDQYIANVVTYPHVFLNLVLAEFIPKKKNQNMNFNQKS